MGHNNHDNFAKKLML